jgi:hypothetical protein
VVAQGREHLDSRAFPLGDFGDPARPSGTDEEFRNSFERRDRGGETDANDCGLAIADCGLKMADSSAWMERSDGVSP